MTKEKISGSYIEETKAVHFEKRNPEKWDVFLTGAGKKESIGRSIEEKLIGNGHFVFCSNEDVISGDFNFNHKGFNSLIMCHGTAHLDWLENTEDKVAKNIIDVNLYGSIRLINEFVRQTINSPTRKKIIAIGSMAYNRVLNASAAYCASKAGLAHYVRCAAWELAPKGYDVYCVHPSNTLDSPMSEETIEGIMRYRNLSRAEAEGYWGAVLPKNSFLKKDEISETIAFLLEGKTEYLSGSQIDLAGGQR